MTAAGTRQAHGRGGTMPILILQILTLVLFALAAYGANARGLNLTAAGLFCWALSQFLPGLR